MFLLFDLKFFPRVIPKARHFYDFNYILRPRYVLPDDDRFRNVLFGQNFSIFKGVMRSSHRLPIEKIKSQFPTALLA
mgnify:CR=1 FL=1